MPGGTVWKYLTVPLSLRCTLPHVLCYPFSLGWHRALDLITIIQASFGAPFQNWCSLLEIFVFTWHLKRYEGIWISSIHFGPSFLSIFHTWVSYLDLYFFFNLSFTYPFCISILPLWFREAGGIESPLLWHQKPVITWISEGLNFKESVGNSGTAFITSLLDSLPLTCYFK